MVKKHLEIKTYIACDVDVTVQIDYDNKTISLVEETKEMGMPKYYKKSWVFTGRGLEFMQGWENILDAMKYAIKQASKELADYLKEVDKAKNDQACEILDLATDLIKAGKNIKRKKK